MRKSSRVRPSTCVSPPPKFRSGSIPAIRKELGTLASAHIADTVRVLYGGSVNAKNIGDIVAQEDVDGALVGGASLDGEQFATLSAIAAGGPLP